ncbi:MAG: hypothetical protein ACOC3G_01545, partial [Phycisphaeraceae bacterium]
MPLLNPHAMNAKTTVLLLVALLAIGGYVLFFELDNLTTREREQRPIDPASGAASLLDAETFTIDSVRRVAIARNGVSMTFAREAGAATSGSAWWQTEPVRFPLRQMPVEDVIRAAVDLRVHRRYT